jgi:hypothetical protein
MLRAKSARPSRGTSAAACSGESPPSGSTTTPLTAPSPRISSGSSSSRAALSRRLLQLILRDKAGAKPGDLYAEIQQVLDSGTLPSYVADSIDAVRAVGNFAAHPMKSKHTGEIASVEPGEAEWLLDTIELLFDLYFVQPARLQERRAALNAKQQDLGKGPIR